MERKQRDQWPYRAEDNFVGHQHRVMNTAWHAQQMPGREGTEQQNGAQAGKSQLCSGCDD